MKILDISHPDGSISIERLLQNSQLPMGDHRRLPQALRNRLAEVAIKQMQAQADSSEVDPGWIF
ncbi:hypothetical protein C8J25_104373 [Sphingomonas faeni]|uniref:Uncharacterized protein n=1 Tax=Sphingomonas faeni TaxID=185950 RepID=A0A2T5U6B1_9SPHN|nr:hypothetical protein [Sphingomonas faeni]PTW47031.1 hypothetical protein C8J25_104373 [Sphingomonas faeni]